MLNLPIIYIIKDVTQKQMDLGSQSSGVLSRYIPTGHRGSLNSVFELLQRFYYVGKHDWLTHWTLVTEVNLKPCIHPKRPSAEPDIQSLNGKSPS